MDKEHVNLDTGKATACNFFATVCNLAYRLYPNCRCPCLEELGIPGLQHPGISAWQKLTEGKESRGSEIFEELLIKERRSKVIQGRKLIYTRNAKIMKNAV